MVRLVDHETRKKTILSATISRFIRNALPVASEDLAEEFSLSSATIRNVFKELEEEGYLTHPYTSAGRIPTDKGYRYYVDFLLSQIELLDEEKKKILEEYKKGIRHIEQLLEKTSEVVAEITHYASIVSFLEWQDKFLYKGLSFILEHPEFYEISKLHGLIGILEEKKRILEILNRDFKEEVRVYIGEELGYKEMEDCALAVSSYGVRNRPKGKIAIIGPKRMEYYHIIPTLKYTSEVLSELLESIF
ncbi:MAG: HTH domain-containing protein [Candidatus Omnitrophica bacterium]|nr:HTH domain-containing protein [Candidatus Omnitrophota bacterium]